MSTSKDSALIVVTSRSFSKSSSLKEKLENYFSNVKYNSEGKHFTPEELIAFLEGATAAIVGLEKIDSTVLKNTPQLKFISKYGVGVDNIDFEALKKFKVGLGWTGGVNKRSVSELALMFALNSQRNFYDSVSNLRAKEWKFDGGNQLSEKTVGIIGCGNIGKDLVSLLKPFGVKILIHDVLDLKEFCGKNGVIQSSLENILKQADIISIHVPYENATHHLIGKVELDLMKKSTILINTSRGNIVDEEALFKALANNQIRGACFDVFAKEPNVHSNLLTLKNFWATPHVGGSTQEAVMAMGNSAIGHLLKYFEMSETDYEF